MDYSIKINEFEGPLDLLLHLIKQSNIDIYDIEISEITKQYLDYINKMEELNINVASSYIVNGNGCAHHNYYKFSHSFQGENNITNKKVQPTSGLHLSFFP